MIRNYFKVAFRSISRHKLFTFINVIGLSIGISASIVIYLIVHYDFTFDKFQPDNNRIYRVVTNFNFSGQIAPNPGVCGPLPGAVKNQVAGLQILAPVCRILLPDVFIPQNGAVPVKFKAQKNVALADKGYFDLIPYKWLAGSARNALNDPYQVVLTSSQAKLYFPHTAYQDMLGKTVMYDTIKTTVTGIVQTLSQNSGFTFHDMISFSTGFANPVLKEDLNLQNWGGTSVKHQLFVKLSPKTTVAQIERQLNSIIVKYNPPKQGRSQKFALQPLSDIHFNTQYGGIAGYDEVASKTTLYSLLGIAMFLLLLGCINFINLTTAQATQRAKEIGIRKTMGSSRAQLIFQFLSENYMVTLMAVIVSALLTPFILQLFSGFIPAGIRFDMMQQPGIIVFLLCLSMVVSLLSGFYPAIMLSAYKPVSVLKNQAQSSINKTRNGLMRKTLTVTQFVIAQVFIMATVLVSKQIYYATHKELGFKKDGIVMISSPWKNRVLSRDQFFLDKLRQIPQIAMVSVGNDAPSSENSSSTEGTYQDGKKEIKLNNLIMKCGDANYIKLYHIKLLAGRNLLPADINKAFMVNLTLTKMLGFKNPQDAIGQTIDSFNGDKRMQIIGVISDFPQESLHMPIEPLVMMTSTDIDYQSTFHIAFKPQTGEGNGWATAFTAIHKVWKQVYPKDDMEYEFVDQSIARFYEKEQHTATLLSWATGLSILISCLGLLGLAIYTTTQRTKEIGVRKVLGASVTQIVTLLSTELMGLILLAFALAAPVAWWAMNKWMQNFADRTAISWWIFVVSGVAMLSAALFTSGFQTIKAAIANPVKSLRSE
ncbi:MAG: FtsX-like permease family protein [Bacteroidota bacterium]